ncbi:nucleotide exchange factor GrpE [Frankia sp. B2]|nr:MULTISPECIES: nucleotide exchange factor GrpE [Frankia]TFE27075.1 nucleotide exchange factor GrpE [Frankia sp. B2]
MPREQRPDRTGHGADQTTDQTVDRSSGEATAHAGPVGADDLPTETVLDSVALAMQVDKLTDRWRRAAADLDNLRKRTVRELERDRAAERAHAAAAWLPVLDHLDLALTHADADPTSLVAGVRTVRDQAVDVLARLGYPRHDEVGVPFDPTRHEALAAVEEPNVPAGTVVAVIRPGYGDTGRQLRPAGVAVSRPPGEPPGGARQPGEIGPDPGGTGGPAE